MEDTQGVILSITLWLPHKYTNENSILKIFLSNNLHSAPLKGENGIMVQNNIKLFFK